VVLRCEWFLINYKRTEWNYRSENLFLRIRMRKKIGSMIQTPMPGAIRANQFWDMEFVSDWLRTARRFRSITSIDTLTKWSLLITVDTSLTSHKVVRVFDRLSELHGLPEYIRAGNGRELNGLALDEWA
jgi:putative transposase